MEQGGIGAANARMQFQITQICLDIRDLLKVKEEGK